MTGVITTEGLSTDNIHTHWLFKFNHRTPAAFPFVCADEFYEATDGCGSFQVKPVSQVDIDRVSSYIMKWTGVPSYRELITFVQDL